MYKTLLCLRYLRTRYIALASIVSITLGVATMIVVNSVMSGFSHEMQTRIHGVLGDVSVDSIGTNGFPDVEGTMQIVRETVGDDVEAMTPICTTAGIMSYKVGSQWRTQEVVVVGIDVNTHGSVGDFVSFLHRTQASFELDEEGMAHRQSRYGVDLCEDEVSNDDPFESIITFDPMKEQHEGAIVGIGLSKVKAGDSDEYLLSPGDDFKLTFPTDSTPPVGITENFTCVDFYESKMSEYDSRLIFIPIKRMQELRGMTDPMDARGNRVNQLQLKLKAGVDLNTVRDKLRAVLDPHTFMVLTWRDQQVTLLQAVEVELSILNVLLFMIIAVSGFGILAIFFMVVIDKTKDIGILKALGASSYGVMSIFLMYGMSLGLLGSGLGLVLGLVFVWNINGISNFLSWMLGHPVFDPDVYYFYQIPYVIDPGTIVWIIAGAMFIAVAASALPAWKAASMEPVKALRYE